MVMPNIGAFIVEASKISHILHFAETFIDRGAA